MGLQRDLHVLTHSFPTRRASDLIDHPWATQLPNADSRDRAALPAPRAAATQLPKASVPMCPPRSGVRFAGSASTASTACSMAAPALSKLTSPRYSPSQLSIIATERMSEVGLAPFLPWMSGAEPCCARAKMKRGSALAFTHPATPRTPA